MPSLVLDSVSKTYRGGVRAVDGVSLTVEDGEMLVLAGPSGCGKTTTLRLVAGLERPSAGTIRIGDRVMNGLAPRDRDVAMVFQNYALYPHLSVRRNLEFGPRMRRVPRADIERRVSEAAALLGLGGLLDRKPAALSGGEQQRVALGRVLVRQPACALYDEPLSNLDASLRHRLRSDLRRLQAAAGTTSIYVTHDQEEAMTLGAQLAVMSGGRVLQVGAQLEIYREPANRFVAGFLGHPPMNFIEGRIAREGEALSFVDGSGITLPLPADIARRAAGARERVVLGIRPEHIHFGPAAPAGFELEITDVEPLGAHTDVSGRVGTVELVMRHPGVCRAKTGERLSVRVDSEHVHLFEPGADGARL